MLWKEIVLNKQNVHIHMQSIRTHKLTEEPKDKHAG